MNKSTMSIIWKLLVASLVVGLALDFFDVSPADLIHDIPQTMGKVYDLTISVIEWGGSYILLGAIIVVPVWLLMNLTWLKDRFRGKN
ncbi:MAG: hypothetical protein COB54_01745 [Alphaproteobacteria bacterium]|nr:MAG: hypothetical protein COB54_01745 [Alphaproteobacteria bacterium]